MSYLKFLMAVIFSNVSLVAMNFDDLSLDVQIGYIRSLLHNENHKASYAKNKKQLVDLQYKKEYLDRAEKHAAQNIASRAIVSNIQDHKQKLQPSVVVPPTESFDSCQGNIPVRAGVSSWLDALRAHETMMDFFNPTGDKTVESELREIGLGRNRRKVLMEKKLQEIRSSR